MIKFISGLPGSGKSLSAVQIIMQERAKPNPRPIYVHGIDGLRDDLALPLDDPMKWQELPHGSLIVIDECQMHFPVRGRGEPIPPIAALTTHRHSGYDFILISQHPNLIDVYVRRLIGEHVHVLRRFGGMTCQRIIWGECVDDPQSMGMRSRGRSEIWRYPKQLFTAYKSATVHTHKRNLPWRLMLIPLCILALIGCAIAFKSVWKKTHLDEVKPVEVSAARAASPRALGQQTPPPGQRPQRWLTTDDYVIAHTPRIAAMPFSSPIFDDRPAVAQPRFLCASTPYKCSCITEQGTKAAMPYHHCRQIAMDGYYDPYRAPVLDQPATQTQLPASPAIVVNDAPKVPDGASFDVQTTVGARPFDHWAATKAGN